MTLDEKYFFTETNQDALHTRAVRLALKVGGVHILTDTVLWDLLDEEHVFIQYCWSYCGENGHDTIYCDKKYFDLSMTDEEAVSMYDADEKPKNETDATDYAWAHRAPRHFTVKWIGPGIQNPPLPEFNVTACSKYQAKVIAWAHTSILNNVVRSGEFKPDEWWVEPVRPVLTLNTVRNLVSKTDAARIDEAIAKEPRE